MKIGDKLARLAKKKGICEEWYEELKQIDNHDLLIEKYLKGIDFCISNDFPTNDFIRANFAGKMESHGVNLDNKFKIVNMRKIVALGSSQGSIEASCYNTCEIFVKHDSMVDVTVKDKAFVVIDVFDNARVTVNASGSSRVLINKYLGANAETNVSGDAHCKVNEKNKKTY